MLAQSAQQAALARYIGVGVFAIIASKN